MAEDVKVSDDELPIKRARLDDEALRDGLLEGEGTNYKIIAESQGSSNVVTSDRNGQGDTSEGHCAFDKGVSVEEETDQTTPHTYEENSQNMPTSSQEKNNEDENNDDANSDVSELSDMSGLSEEAWKSSAGSIAWIHRQMMLGQNPRTILSTLIADDSTIPEGLDELTLWKIVVNILTEPPRREKLTQYNTVDDALQLIQHSKRIVVLTGAGVSVSCGIPDFRSRNGIYARLAVDFPNLPDPQAMFDIKFFRSDQRPFFKFAKEIYPGQFEPSRSHKFIRLIEDHGKLLRNYTQNIDTLEQVAGIQNVIQCHGSFAKATCMACRTKVDAEEIRSDIFNQVIPQCKVCPTGTEMAVMKPDIVFFGESLPDEFHNQMSEDKEVCDLLIVIGSSLKVRPVALIPNSLPPSVPQILINREPLKHLTFDIELLGDCDIIISELCRRLGEGWDKLSTDHGPMSEISKHELPTPPGSPIRDGEKTTETKATHSGLPGRDEEKVTETSEEISNPVCSNETRDLDIKPSASQQELSAASARLIDNKNIPQKDLNTNNASGVLNDNTSETLLDNPAKEDEKVGGKDNTTGEDTVSSDPLDTDTMDKGNKDNVDVDRNMEDEEIRLLRSMWHRRESIAKQLKEDQYLFLPPNRYVFPGAEVFTTEREDDPSHFPARMLSSSSSLSISSGDDSVDDDDDDNEDDLHHSEDNINDDRDISNEEILDSPQTSDDVKGENSIKPSSENVRSSNSDTVVDNQDEINLTENDDAKS